MLAVVLLGGWILAGTPARAAGDVAAGRDLFAARCAACHGIKPTRKPGPLLSGVFGRRAGSVAGYHYSDALKSASVTWDAANLDRWLSGPPAFIPGANMQAQVDSPQDRRNLIAYLRSLGTPARDHSVQAP